MEQLGLNLGYLLVQIVCFFIIFVVVRVWIVKPLQGMLEKRRQKITQQLEDSRIAAEARANAEVEAKGVIADARVKAAHIISEATERADAAMGEVKADTNTEMAKMREAALAETKEERNQILSDLRGQVAVLAIAAAQKLVGESLDEKRQRALIDEFFSGVRSGKVVVLEGEKLAGEKALVTSALPLTNDEQEKVKSDVISKMGKDAEVEFKVDPTILGGLVVKVGDKVLNGSVSGQLESLRQSMR
ncbi:MAG: F0F1 ATP synthase subunit B [Chloroflexota bacterium]